MNSEQQPRLSRFAIRIAIILYGVKIMARSLKSEPITDKDPKRKTLKEVEFDLWAHELEKRANDSIGKKPQKLLSAPQNG
jgi:hypothetical protein